MLFQLTNRLYAPCWAAVPLRLIVGYGFMAHGLAKWGRGADSFANILDAIGVPAPYLMSWATILVEVFGGLAVLLGAFVPLVSIPMAGAIASLNVSVATGIVLFAWRSRVKTASSD